MKRNKLKRLFQVAMKWNRGRRKRDPLKIIPSVTFGAFGKFLKSIPYQKTKVFKYKKGEMRRKNT